MSLPPTRVVLIDDHPLIRAGLTAQLELDGRCVICGEATDARSAKEMVLREAPAAVVLDLMLGDDDGLTLIRELRQLAPELHLVVLTMLDPAEYRARALAAGANVFVSKADGADAVLRALLNQRHLPPTGLNGGAGASSAPPPHPEVSRLSDRELQVFHLIGLGRTTREISAALGVSPKTVDAHKEHIKLRLGLVNASQLTARAARWAVQKIGSPPPDN